MALGRLKKARTAVTSAPKAVKQFGKTLVAEGKADVARQGSPAQRFSDSPLGQYYLPKPARAAASFLAPSPRKVVRDVSNVARRPRPGNAAAAGGDVLSIATLPALVSGAGRLAARGGPRAAMALRGGEAGNISKFPSRGNYVERIRAQVFNKIKAGQGGENRTQFLNRRIGEIRKEIEQIDAGNARHAAREGMSNLRDIRSKAVPKGKALPRGLKAGEEGWIRLHKEQAYGLAEGDLDFTAHFGPGRTPKAFRTASPKKMSKIAERIFSVQDFPKANKVPIAQIYGSLEKGEVHVSSLNSAGKYNVLGSPEMEALNRFAKAKGAKSVRFHAAGESQEIISKVTGKPLGEGVARHKLFAKRIAQMGLKNARASFLGGEEGFIRFSTKDPTSRIEPVMKAATEGSGIYSTHSVAMVRRPAANMEELLHPAKHLTKELSPSSASVRRLQRVLSDVRGNETRHLLDALEEGKFGPNPTLAGVTEPMSPKVARLTQRLTKALKGGEEGFLRLPKGGGEDDAAHKVVRKANLRATRSVLRHNLGTARSFLSMETDSNLGHIDALAKYGAKYGMKGDTFRISGMESSLPSKTVGHLVRKEKVMRAAMRKIGMSPGKVVRGQGSIVEIEGRMPLTGALKRLGETDRLTPEKVEKLAKLTTHARRFPRN